VEDAPEIARVHIEAWHRAYRGLLPDEILDGLDLPARVQRWRELLTPATRGKLTLVAELEGAVEGFATVAVPARDAEEARDVGEIPAIYVSPSAWGGGTGTALLVAALEEMRHAGCREAILWMLARNQRAEAFYRHHGWRADGGTRSSQYFPGVKYASDRRELTEVRFRRAL
jgi:GNAT superfamily N-acetyltransferase